MTFTPDSDGSVGSRLKMTTAGGRSESKSRVKKPLIAAIVFCGLLFLGGFAYFLSEVERFQETTPDSVSGDGIVVLTGGFARLAPAVELLKMERGARLLISGVNPQNSDGSLKNALNVDDELYDCCVDLDQDAMDTIGNAVGIAHWAASKNYSKIIVVTNDYHMPRSVLEIKRQMSSVEIVPYVVRNQPQANETFSTKLDRYRVLSSEYLKFIATNFRHFFKRSNSTNGVVSAGLSTGW
ncbi:MAG: YdcF family protein [Pseudomonadota bacterium]